MIIAWGWGGHKKRYIHLGSADLKPGNITYTTENGITVYQKGTTQNVTNCAHVPQAKEGWARREEETLFGWSIWENIMVGRACRAINSTTIY